MNLKKFLGWTSLAVITVFTGRLAAQPVPAPRPIASDPTYGHSILCSVDTGAAFQGDTVVSTPDSNGFYTIFNGKDFTGWWNLCLSTHSSNNRVLGAQFIVDTNQKAIYAMQRNGCYQLSTGDSGGTGCTNIDQDGGLLATHKKYGNYELIFDWWPDYGNDGGIFNRLVINNGTTVSSNQMVMDYLYQSGVLSYYSEQSFPGARNGRPWSYNIANATTPGVLSTGDTSLIIPGFGGTGTTGAPGSDQSNWTSSTKNIGNPTQYGCAATGCVAADYKRLWIRYGWVQVREKLYGGLSTNQGGVTAFTQSPTGTADKGHGFTWFRTFYPTDTTGMAGTGWVAGVTDTAQWIPVVQDSFSMPASDFYPYAQPNPFAFQVHGNMRYRYASQGGKGSWMRNIKVRELDSLGNPLFLVGSCPHCTGGTSTAISPSVLKPAQYNLRVVSGYLVGSVSLDHVVIVNDLAGRQVQIFSGMAGNNLKYAIPTSGTFIVQVRTSHGTQTLRVINGVSQ